MNHKEKVKLARRHQGKGEGLFTSKFWTKRNEERRRKQLFQGKKS